jgi:hypothetical protein
VSGVGRLHSCARYVYSLSQLFQAFSFIHDIPGPDGGRRAVAYRSGRSGMDVRDKRKTIPDSKSESNQVVSRSESAQSRIA